MMAWSQCSSIFAGIEAILFSHFLLRASVNSVVNLRSERRLCRP